MEGKLLSFLEMIEEIEEYYQAEGFDNPYRKDLNGKSEDQIYQIYEELFLNPM